MQLLTWRFQNSGGRLRGTPFLKPDSLPRPLALSLGWPVPVSMLCKVKAHVSGAACESPLLSCRAASPGRPPALPAHRLRHFRCPRAPHALAACTPSPLASQLITPQGLAVPAPIPAELAFVSAADQHTPRAGLDGRWDPGGWVTQAAGGVG